MSPMTVMWCGAFIVIGWFVFFIFGRQIMYNLRIAFPLIKKIRGVNEDLIAIGAKRYTIISCVVMSVFLIIAFALAIIFCPVAFLMSFLIGFFMGLFSYIPVMTVNNKEMFETFMFAYYKFVPDDALRTAMYNKKVSQVKVRLHEMEISTDWIPEFKKN